MDERLRALRRATEARATDPDAGHDLALALERTGDARGAWLERCRLARELNDPTAWEALAWRPEGVTSGTRPLARRPIDGHECRVVEPGDAPWPVPALVLLVAPGRGHVVVLDPRDLQERWRASARLATRCGSVVVLVQEAPPGDELVFVELADGRERARVHVDHVEAIAATLDRLVVVSGTPPAASVLDCGARPGAAVGKLDGAFQLARGGRLFFDRGGATTSRALADTASAWTFGRGQLLASDWRGVVVSRETPEGAALAELDPLTGRARWCRALRGARARVEVRLTDGLVLCAEEGRLRLRAFERDDGATRWEWDAVERFRWASEPVPRDVLYVVAASRFPRVLGVDLRDGGVLFEHAPNGPSQEGVQVAPFDGTYVVAVQRHPCTLVQLQG